MNITPHLSSRPVIEPAFQRQPVSVPSRAAKVLPDEERLDQRIDLILADTAALIQKLANNQNRSATLHKELIDAAGEVQTLAFQLQNLGQKYERSDTLHRLGWLFAPVWVMLGPIGPIVWGASKLNLASLQNRIEETESRLEPAETTARTLRREQLTLTEERTKITAELQIAIKRLHAVELSNRAFRLVAGKKTALTVVRKQALALLSQALATENGLIAAAAKHEDALTDCCTALEHSRNEIKKLRQEKGDFSCKDLG